MVLRIRLLGSVDVRRDGQPVPLRALKRVALLVALALNCNQPTGLDDLVSAVWADDPPRSAVANLRNYASALRRAVGDRITTYPGAYRLVLHDGELDAAEFRALARAGHRALDARRPADAADLLTRALGLWRGTVAGGMTLGGSLGIELDNLDQQRLTAFDDLVQAQLDLGHHAELIPQVRAHLHRVPLRERSWAHLMLARYRSGDVAGALASYSAAREMLREHLGIEPGAMLTDLHRAILNRSADIEPPAPAARGDRHPSRRTDAATTDRSPARQGCRSRL